MRRTKQTFTPETFRMETHMEGLLEILGNNFYEKSDAFMRELLQNAHDSLVLRKAKDLGHHCKIDISVDNAAGNLCISENGIGMDRNDIKQFLSVIGASSKKRALSVAEPVCINQIGQFGIGLLSAFVVASPVTVITRKEGSESLRWENFGSADCTLASGNRSEIGTDVILVIREDFKFVLDEEYLREAIIRYANLLPFPIMLNGMGPVNAIYAPWDSPDWFIDSRRDAICRMFIDRTCPDMVLDIIPFDFAGGLRASGILYITGQRAPDYGAKGVVDVYIKRMFVKNDESSLLPPWAKFIRGVVECPDLKPTASRDSIKGDDDTTTQLRNLLGNLIIERLQTLTAQDPERFQQINRWHHYHLKAMACFHDEFFDRICEYLLFTTNRGERSLGECLAIARDSAVAGTVPALDYLADPGAASQFHRLADAGNGLVINAGRGYDEDLLRKYAEKNREKMRLVRIDVADNSPYFMKLPEQEAALFRRLEIALEGEVQRSFSVSILARTRSFKPHDLPAMVLRDRRDEADQQIRDVLDHPDFSGLARAVAAEVTLEDRPRMLHLTLNAENRLVRMLADWHKIERDDLASGVGVNFTSMLLAGLFTTAVVSSHTLMNRDTAEAVARTCSWLLEGSIRVQQRLAEAEAENLQLHEELHAKEAHIGSRAWNSAGRSGVC